MTRATYVVALGALRDSPHRPPEAGVAAQNDPVVGACPKGATPPRYSSSFVCQSRRPGSLARFLPGFRYGKPCCQVFTPRRVFPAVEGTHWGQPLPAWKFAAAFGSLCPALGSHCQSLSGGLSAPQPPLVFPSAGGVEWAFSPVSWAWQRHTLRSHTPSPPTWGPRRRPPLGGRRVVGEGNGDTHHPRGAGREEPGPTAPQVLLAQDDERARILALATDFPKLWHAPSTSDRDHKRMARLLLEDVNKRRRSGQLRAHRGNDKPEYLYDPPGPDTAGKSQGRKHSACPRSVQPLLHQPKQVQYET